MNNSLQIKRIQNEIIDMKRNPSDMYVASPLEVSQLDFSSKTMIYFFRMIFEHGISQSVDLKILTSRKVFIMAK